MLTVFLGIIGAMILCLLIVAIISFFTISVEDVQAHKNREASIKGIKSILKAQN